MIEVVFVYKGIETTNIRSEKSKTIKDIFQQHALLKEIDINNVNIVHNLNQINKDLTLNEIVTNQDEIKRNKLILFVYDKN